MIKIIFELLSMIWLKLHDIKKYALISKYKNNQVTLPNRQLTFKIAIQISIYRSYKNKKLLCEYKKMRFKVLNSS